MIHTFEALAHINFIFVWLEGLLSFFSPCVIPLLPLYMSYLAGTKIKNADGTMKYQQKIVLLHTLFFVLGISTAFFLLGLSATIFGQFLKQYQTGLELIGGGFILLFGLFQFGVIRISYFTREHKMKLPFQIKKMNFMVAFFFGFFFSFAWTPCVGPALSSVLILAGSQASMLTGSLYIILYAFGFFIPFLFLGIFTTATLNFFRKNQKLLSITTKISALILVLIGLMLLVNGIKETSTETVSNTDSYLNQNVESFETNFKLKDISSKEYQLTDMVGKTVFINFLDIHCTPCQNEIGAINQLYQDYGRNQKEVIVLAIAKLKDNKNDIKEIKEFIRDNKIKFPVLLDTTHQVSKNYHVTSYPTTYMIEKTGTVYGYMIGELTNDMMQKMIEQTKLKGK